MEILPVKRVPFDDVYHLNPSMTVDKGVQPALAMSGQFILEVHKSQSTDHLWTTVRETKWSYDPNYQPIDDHHDTRLEGYNPCLAFNRSAGKFMLVFEEKINKSTKLAMRSGGFFNRQIGFSPTKFGYQTILNNVLAEATQKAVTNKKDKEKAGHLITPAIATEERYYVVACGTPLGQLVACVFEQDQYASANQEKLEYGQDSAQVYAYGTTPSIAISRERVVEVHMGLDMQLCMMLGDIRSKKINWYAQVPLGMYGTQPSITWTEMGDIVLAFTGLDGNIRMCEVIAGPMYDEQGKRYIQVSAESVYEKATHPRLASEGKRVAMMFQYGNDHLRFASADREYEPFDNRADHKNTSWMHNNREAIRNKQLNMVLLPGTHDSGSYDINMFSKVMEGQDIPNEINWDWVVLPAVSTALGFGLLPGLFLASGTGKFIANWAQAQSLNIEEQLRSGIRYLDVRVARDGKDFYMCHSMKSANVDKLLDAVARFVHDNPEEIILLDFNHLYNMEGPKKDPDAYQVALCEKIKAKLGDRIAGPNLHPHSKVSEFWTTNRTVIVMYDDYQMASRYGFWNQGTIDSPWLNTQDEAVLLKGLTSNLSNRDANTKTLYVSQGMLTPDINMLKHHPFSSLKKVAKKVTPAVTSWIDVNKDKKINIVIVDWFQLSKNYVDTIVEINKSRK